MATRSKSKAAKYAQLTVFDPSTTSARLVAPKAPQPLQADDSERVPLLDKAYACDDADDRTLEQLRGLSGDPMYTLMAKRHHAMPKPGEGDCPRECPPMRRRCFWCPWLALLPEDDDLPF